MLKRIFDRYNRIGSAYALTTFARVLPGREAELERYLEALPVGAASPFARIETLHIARVQVFRALVRQGSKQPETDVLQNAHLVFTSTIDGDLDAYLDTLAERVPECDEWWGRCAGYPGRADRAAFRGYVRARRVRTSLLQAAFPDASPAEVREALALRERVIDFAVAAQDLDAAELHAHFRAEF